MPFEYRHCSSVSPRPGCIPRAARQDSRAASRNSRIPCCAVAESKRKLRQIARLLCELDAALVARAGLGGLLQRRLLVEQLPERLRLEQAAPSRRSASSSSANTARASGVHAASPRAPLVGEPRCAAPRSARPRRRSGGRRAGARRCRSSGSPGGGRRRRSGRAGGSGRAARRSRRRSPSRHRGRAGGRGNGGASRRRPCRAPVSSHSVDQQRHARVAEPERGQPAELLAERETQARPRARSRRSRVRGREIVVGRAPSRRSAPKASANASTLLGADRQTGGGAVAAEALEVLGTGRQSRRAGRTSRPRGPSPSSCRRAAGDQDDRAAVALDRAARRRCRSRPRASRRPRRRSRDGRAARPARTRSRLIAARRIRSSTAWRSRFSVLELLGEHAPPRCASSVSSSASAASGRPSRPDGVDPRCEPEADRALVAGGRIDAGDLHQRPQPGLLRLREPLQAERARAHGSRRPAARHRRPSRARPRRGAARGTGGSGPSSAWASFQTTAVPQRPCERIVALQRRDDGAIREASPRGGGGR